MPIDTKTEYILVPNTTAQKFLDQVRQSENWDEFHRRTAAAFARTENAQEAIPGLLALLHDEDGEVRARAICALGKIKEKPKEVVPEIVRALGDEVPKVRWVAAAALRDFGDDAKISIPALEKQAADDNSPIAVYAAGIIRSIDSEHDVDPYLVRLLKSSNIEHRRMSAAYLGRSKSRLAKQALVEAYAVEMDEGVKANIAQSVTQIESHLLRR